MAYGPAPCALVFWMTTASLPLPVAEEAASVPSG